MVRATMANDTDQELCHLTFEIPGGQALAQQFDAVQPIVGKTVHWTVFRSSSHLGPDSAVVSAPSSPDGSADTLR